jgi:hypothetical protein
MFLEDNEYSCMSFSGNNLLSMMLQGSNLIKQIYLYDIKVVLNIFIIADNE